MSRSFCPRKLGGVESSRTEMCYPTSAFVNFKSLASHPRPRAETQRNPTCRAGGGWAPQWACGSGAGVLVRRRRDGGRQAAARDPACLCLACAWSPSATYRARHRLGSRSEDPPRDLRARSGGGMSVSMVGLSLLGGAVPGR